MWGRSAHSTRVFLEQKRGVRIVCGLPHNSSCRDSFCSLEILLLYKIYMVRVVLFKFKEREIITTRGYYHRFPTRFGNGLHTPRHWRALSEQAVKFSLSLLNELPQVV